MKPNPNIDELLNSFLDDELPPRQRTEVQRLIAHDQKIANRLDELEKCKTLLNALPFEVAPDEMAEDIKIALERRALLGPQHKEYDERTGARHLLMRKITATAAMIALIAALSAVVYNIVALVKPVTRIVALEDSIERTVKIAQPKLKPAERVIVKETTATEPVLTTGFNATLELKAVETETVASAINKAVTQHGLLDTAYPGARTVSSLNCTRAELNLLLADLQTVWSKLDSAKFVIKSPVPGSDIVVENAKIEQIVEIVNQTDTQRRDKAAKYFAIINNMAAMMPRKDIITDIGADIPSSMAIPKPVLTSGELLEKTKQTSDERFELTIAVIPVASEK